MPYVAKLGRVAGAVVLALGVTANVNAALVQETRVFDEVDFFIKTFDITSLVSHTVTLSDNNFLTSFDTLALAITKTGGETVQTLTAPGSFSFTPTATGSYTAIVFGDPGVSNGIELGTFGVTVAAVPEAETWAMMLVGMGLVGWQLRRKVKASAASRFV